MKRLLIAILLAPCLAWGAFPQHSNISTVNIDKITGNWDSFQWKWAGYDSQTNAVCISNNTSAVNLTGYTVYAKISRYSDTGLVTYFSSTNATVSNSNVLWTVAYTNIPPNGTYLTEALAIEGTTNLTRTIWQGKITVFDSIYGDNDGNYPFSTVTSLVDYVTLVNYNTHTALQASAHGGQITAVSNLAQSASDTAAIASNLVESAIDTQTVLTAWINNASNIASSASNTAWAASNAIIPAVSNWSYYIAKSNVNMGDLALTNVTTISGTAAPYMLIEKPVEGDVAFSVASGYSVRPLVTDVVNLGQSVGMEWLNVFANGHRGVTGVFSDVLLCAGNTNVGDKLVSLAAVGSSLQTTNDVYRRGSFPLYCIGTNAAETNAISWSSPSPYPVSVTALTWSAFGGTAATGNLWKSTTAAALNEKGSCVFSNFTVTDWAFSNLQVHIDIAAGEMLTTLWGGSTNPTVFVHWIKD